MKRLINYTIFMQYLMITLNGLSLGMLVSIPHTWYSLIGILFLILLTGVLYVYLVKFQSYQNKNYYREPAHGEAVSFYYEMKRLHEKSWTYQFDVWLTVRLGFDWIDLKHWIKKKLGMETRQAIWTDEQVKNLNTWQHSGRMHEFTCPNRHVDRTLVATRYGWKCNHCDYTQDWAHDFMLEPLPPHPFFDNQNEPGK